MEGTHEIAWDQAPYVISISPKNRWSDGTGESMPRDLPSMRVLVAFNQVAQVATFGTMVVQHQPSFILKDDPV